MKRYIISSAVFAAGVCLALATDPSAHAQKTPVVPGGKTPEAYKAEMAQQEAAAKAQKRGAGFEYKCTDEAMAKARPAEKVQELATRYNKEGWELVAFDIGDAVGGDTVCFRRRLP